MRKSLTLLLDCMATIQLRDVYTIIIVESIEKSTKMSYVFCI